MRIRSASSDLPQAAAAVAQVAAQLGPSATDLVMAFVPVRYDLAEAGRALTGWAGSRVIACTSAGGIGPAGYTEDALVVVTLSAPDLKTVTVPITDLDDLDQAAGPLAAAIRQVADPERATFAFLLVDGLSMREEILADTVMMQCGDIPILGGSAGDDLRFQRAAVLVNGCFQSGAATLTLVTMSAPWRRFRIQHHQAGEPVAVVTSVDAPNRLVRTLNGRPAIYEYAAMTGVPEHLLTPVVYSRHPLLLRAGGGEWVRSIASPGPEGSLRLFCAAERGTILRLGHSRSPRQAIQDTLAHLEEELGGMAGAVIFDCVLRRLEFQDDGIADEIGSLLSGHRMVGFSTYGEQFDGVHVNQTMVGIAFGDRHEC